MNIRFLSLLILAAVFPGVVFSASNAVVVSATVPQANITTPVDPASGATVTLVNTDHTSVSFVVPANMYAVDLTFEANSYANDFFSVSEPAPAGENFVGKTYDFNFYTAVGDKILTLAKVVDITIQYTAADVSGLNENGIVPYRREVADTSWQQISNYHIDTQNHTVTFSTSQFSSFALLAPPLSAGGGGGGGGVSGGSGVVVSPPSLPAKALQDFGVAYRQTLEGIAQQIRAIAVAIANLNNITIFKKAKPSIKQPSAVQSSSQTGSYGLPTQHQANGNGDKKALVGNVEIKAFGINIKKSWFAELTITGVQQMGDMIHRAYVAIGKFFTGK